MIKKASWRANGKLLITGEYLVMEGARAFAVPVVQGQLLQVKYPLKSEQPVLIWKALKPAGLWFEVHFSIPSLKITYTDDEQRAIQLQKILESVRFFNPRFLADKESVFVETHLDFPPEYGFGSSSTLIANLARWATIDPFALQMKALGGSAYDVACALADNPLIYQLKNKKPVWQEIAFHPLFSDHLFFVYLGNKQSSAREIRYFKEDVRYTEMDILKINSLTDQIVLSSHLDSFVSLLKEHEKIVSEILKKPRVQELYFNDFEGVVKSLGAWGGDFVLCATKMEKKDFVKKMNHKGYSTIFAWNQLVLNA